MKFTINLTPLFNHHRKIVLIITLTSLLLCGGLPGKNASAEQINRNYISQSSQSQNTTANLLPKAIATAILRDAAKHSSIPTRNLQITQVTPKTFSNQCVFNFNEICTQEYNPIEGWEVTVLVQKQSWKYHVNKSSTKILLDPTLKKTTKN